jgi:hypothetical protein
MARAQPGERVLSNFANSWSIWGINFSSSMVHFPMSTRSITEPVDQALHNLTHCKQRR